MIYGYIRVSTDKQSTENQRFEIERFAKANGIVIGVWIEETISASKALDKRKLGMLISAIKTGDIIIASELSRLGRNLLQVMSILHHCLSSGAVVWTIKDNYRLGQDIQSKVLAFAFGLAAEIERNLISQRTKEALARLKVEGKVLGRPKGRKSTKVKLSGKEETIRNMLRRGLRQYVIAKRLHVHRITLSNFIKIKGI
ncbi:master DNA invertase Mpi family serine-type recombinase [Deferribacterales bacterium RsTz2092]|nr:invertase [Deferribacterales bacterium]